MRNKRKKGFTLIEMIVVIAILAVLSVALIPLIANLIEKSRVSRLLADLDLIRTASLSLQADIGTLDDSVILQDTADLTVTTLCQNTSDLGVLARWDGPYLEAGIDHSPWGGTYGVDFVDVDQEVPATGTSIFKTDDWVLEVNDTDEESENAPVTNAVEIAQEVNKNLTGDTDGGDNVRVVTPSGTTLRAVILANVSN